MSDQQTAPTNLSPRQRWGTCCPSDPECEHSFMDDRELSRWMHSPITDALAAEIAGAAWDCSTCRDSGLVGATGNGGDGYERCPDCSPPPETGDSE